MNRIIALTIGALGTALGSAVAAGPIQDASTTCQRLLKQFDTSAMTHAGAPEIRAARALRVEAEQACGSGRYAEGVTGLRAALEKLGVRPVITPTS